MEGLSAGHASNPDQTELASRSINSIRAKGVTATIPDICVGELVRVVGEKKLEIDLQVLLKELGKGRLAVGHVKEDDLMLYSNLIARIRKVDKFPESSDVRILAFAMADRNCRGLLTFERKLIESTNLQRFIAKQVNFKKGHLITDDPFGR